jgi:hypothetical protein
VILANALSVSREVPLWKTRVGSPAAPRRTLADLWDVFTPADRTTRCKARRTDRRSKTLIPVPVPADNPTDVQLNGNQTALAGFSHHLQVNVTKADDATLATESRAMAGSYTEQSKAVAERAGSVKCFV